MYGNNSAISVNFFKSLLLPLFDISTYFFLMCYLFHEIITYELDNQIKSYDYDIESEDLFPIFSNVK